MFTNLQLIYDCIIGSFACGWLAWLIKKVNPNSVKLFTAAVLLSFVLLIGAVFFLVRS
jgi:hypothetical protein